MRAKVFLLKASCILLSAFLICGKTAPLAYCQQLVADLSAIQPQFITDIMMDLQYKKTAILNFVSAPVNTIGTKATAGTQPAEKKTPEELINYLIKKNSTENKDMTFVVPADSAAILTNDSAALATNTIPAPADSAAITAVGEPLKPGGEEINIIDEEIDPLINKYAEMISVEPEDISNYPLYRFIDKWYGVRYRYGGCSEKGIDCSAFSQKLCGDIYSVDIPRTSRMQYKRAEYVKYYDDATEGDLIFFRIRRIRVSHVGVYLANGYFVHASRSRGVMISSLNDKYWQRRYAGCGKVAKEDRANMESDYIQ